MDAVKAVFGVVMLGVAIYLLERIISPVAAMCCGASCWSSRRSTWAISPVPEGRPAGANCGRGRGIAILVYGTLFLSASPPTARTPCKAAARCGARSAAVGGRRSSVAFKRIKTSPTSTANWLPPRRRAKPVMPTSTPTGASTASRWRSRPSLTRRCARHGADVLLQADVTDNDDADKALQQHRHTGTAGDDLLGPDGMERKHLRLLGFMGPEDFAPSRERGAQTLKISNYFLIAVGGAVIGAASGFAWRASTTPAAEVQTPVAAVRQVDVLPNFTYPDLDGRQRSNDEFADKVVVLNFWATWCPPAARRRRNSSPCRLLREQVQFIGIAIDDEDPVREFADTYGVNYPLLLGDVDAVAMSRSLGNRYEGLPFTVVARPGGGCGACATQAVWSAASSNLCCAN